MKQLPNVLIAENEIDDMALYEAILRKMDVNLIKTYSGAEAIEKTKGVELALAVIDVWMPGMNGYEIALRLNEDRPDERVPVIFLTASYVSEMQIFEGYGFGAVDYIFKPVDNTILKCKIEVFLDLFKQKQTLSETALLLKKNADELIRVNDALRTSEEQYRSYIDNAPDGVFITDEMGKYIEVNEAASVITGYSKDELLRMSLLDMIPSNTIENCMAELKKVMKSGTSNSDMLFKDKIGTERWWTLQAVKLSETRILCFAKDISIKKKAEEELTSSLDQLHQLTQYIEKVRENERVSVSRELHDDLGQALTAVEIDLGLIKQTISQKKIVGKLNNVLTSIRDIIKRVQQISAYLRPQIIDDLGLVPAIEWYAKKFAQRNGVELYSDLDPDIILSHDASLATFRILQESLTNISRHAKATQVDIGLIKTGNYLNLRISDNGIGIPEAKLKAKNSFGLMSMKERARSIGGVFNIYKENKRGTVINLIIPLNGNTAYENSDL
ncbi:PAS domain S-box protein [Bacteroidota bacterium]